MIPIKDSVPSYSFPIVMLTLIVTNVVVFFYEQSVPESLVREFFFQYGLVARRFFEDEGLNRKLISIFTSMFIHGGFWHLLGNMWFLWVFGDNVEDRFGHFRFLMLYLLSGIVAAILQVSFNPNDVTPMVGASGSIAGVLGAYLILFPNASILTLVPIFIFVTFIHIPAFFFLALWFALQFIYGISSFTLTTSIAWWAHVGGFLSGIVLAFMLPKKTKRIA